MATYSGSLSSSSSGLSLIGFLNSVRNSSHGSFGGVSALVGVCSGVGLALVSLEFCFPGDFCSLNDLLSDGTASSSSCWTREVSAGVGGRESSLSEQYVDEEEL